MKHKLNKHIQWTKDQFMVFDVCVEVGSFSLLLNHNFCSHVILGIACSLLFSYQHCFAFNSVNLLL